MPCFYPEGTPAEWCERHAKDHVMLMELRGAPVRAPVARVTA